jgi:hypothetical protein
MRALYIKKRFIILKIFYYLDIWEDTFIIVGCWSFSNEIVFFIVFKTILVDLKFFKLKKNSNT